MPELMPIAVEYINVGDVAKSDIYVKYRDPLLMIKGGVFINERMLRSLAGRDESKSRNIYVEPKYYYELLNKGVPASLRQEQFEKDIGYDVDKQEMGTLIDYLKESNILDVDKAMELSDNLSEKVTMLDAATIMQCINGKNKVDEYLRTHSTNVSMLNGLMGRWMDLPEEEIDLLVICGLLHDIGKTKVPAEILNAPRKLTPEEFEQIKMHSIHSYNILSECADINPMIATIARSHHEKMNGTGYPDGLTGEVIPLYAKITAISDVYDAMISTRCYKDANSPFLILDQLANDKFSDLDFDLIGLFLKKMPEEMIGKSVLLSNGSIGKVKYIDVHKWKYPIIEVDGQVVPTTDDLYCISITI